MSFRFLWKRRRTHTWPLGPCHRSVQRGNGRGEKIRTSDPLHPMQVRYQAALRPDAKPWIIPASWIGAEQRPNFFDDLPQFGRGK